MRKVMKSVSLIAILCLLAAFLPMMGDKALTAFAADGDFTVENGVLIAYDGVSNTVTIPDGVTEIKSDAFSAADTCAILSVVFPGSLKTVPADAFNACSSLREIYVQAANPYYSSVDGVLFSKNGQILKCYPAAKPGGSYTVPANVNTILNYAFYHCGQLKSVVMPENLAYVYDHAFVACGVTSVTFPEAVTVVGGSAFIDCDSLRTVTVLAAAGARVNANAFDDCSAIKRVNFNGTSEDWDSSTWKTALCNSGSSFGTFFFSYNSSDFTVENGTLTAYNGRGGNVVIPDGVTKIGNDAFSGAAVTSVVIPDTMNTIPSTAFCNCPSLQELYADNPLGYHSVDGMLLFDNDTELICYPQGKKGLYPTLPDSVTVIGPNAFAGCTHPSTVHLPANLTTIYTNAFAGSSIEYITIPAKVNEVSKGAFADCASLRTLTIKAKPDARLIQGVFSRTTGITKVVFEGTQEQWESSAWKGALDDSGSAYEVTCAFTVDENSVLTAYNGNGGDVTIPDGVTKIGNNVFKNNTYVTSVTMPSSVTQIRSGAFSGTRLTSVTIPASVTWIANNAFAGCSALQAFRSEDGGFYHAIDGVLLYNHDTGIRCYPQGRTNSVYIVPSTVTEIGNYAFADCQSLTTVVLPDHLEKICACAFDNSGITYITIPAKVTNLYGSTFLGCASLETVTILAPDAATYGASEFSGCTGIRNVYFEGTQAQWESSSWKTALDASGSSYAVTPAFTVDEDGLLTEYQGEYGDVVIPDGVTGIDEFAFFGPGTQHFLKTVTVPASVTSIDACAFDYAYSLTAINVAEGNPKYCSVDGVLFNKDRTKLVRYPQCKAGRNYKVPSTVTIVGESAFYHCDALTSVTLPASVKTLQGYALNACSSLTKLTVPASVTRVGEYAFGNCKALKTVTILAKSPTVSTYPFNGAPVATVHYVGTESEWNASGWKKVLADAAVDFNYSVFAITQQPVSVSGAVGDTVTFSVTATGSDLTYQWYAKMPDRNGFAIWNGKTEASISTTIFESWNGAQIYCVVRDGTGKSVRSDTVTLTVTAALTITQQPADVSGEVGGTATFSVTATGDNLTYQWYLKKAADTDFTAWNKKTTASVSTPIYKSWDGAQFYCIVKDGSGKTVQSDTVKLTVTTALTITQQPADVSGEVGETATFSVTATGSDLTYQWYLKKSDDTDFTAWNKKTTASVSTPIYASWDGAQFYCVVRDGSGKTVQSDTVKLTVTSLRITQQPVDVTGEVGDTATFSVSATGQNLTYQWYMKKADDTDFAAWNKKTEATVSTPIYASWNGAQFYCVVKDGGGKSVKSSTATLTVMIEAPIIMEQPVSVVGAAGETATFSVFAVGDGLTYQWYMKKTGDTDFTAWNKKTEATVSTTIYKSWDGAQFYCLVKNNKGGSVKTETVCLTVHSIQIIKQPENVLGAVGDTATFSVTATGSNLTYQWYIWKPGDEDFIAWNKKTEATVSTPIYASWDGTRFYCLIQDDKGGAVKTETVMLMVTSIQMISQTPNVSGAVGGTATFSVNVKGSHLHFQWYVKKAGDASFTAWNKKTSASVSTPIYASWNGAQFFCLIEDDKGHAAESDVVTLTVTPKITAQPANVSGAVNGTAKFSVTATGAGLSYQWYYKKAGQSDWTKWNGQTKNAASLTVYRSWNNAQFYCVVKDSSGKTVKSNAATLTVK